MLLPCAAALAACHTLVFAPPVGEPDPCAGFGSPSVAAVPVIARPEASDLYVPVKTRTTAAAMLERNPELLRAAHVGSPYRVHRALALGWQCVRGSNLPAARAWNALRVTRIPEPTGVLLVALAPLLLFLRRRAPRAPAVSGPTLARRPRLRSSRV